MQTIAAPISGDYNAKGESLETLIKFQNGSYIEGGKHLSYYTFAFHIVFPLLGVLLVANLLHHFMENNELILLRSDNSTVKDIHDLGELKISTVNMTVYISVTCCFLFVLFVITLDCIGVNKRVFFVQEEIYYSEGKSGNESILTLMLEFSVPAVMLAEDLLVLILMSLMCWRKMCTKSFTTDKKLCDAICCSRQWCKWSSGSNKKWYNIIMGPISCLLIHSYHIMVGFIHTPHHATSMLVFYALMIVTFILTLKAAYYNLFKLYQWHQKQSTCNCVCRALFCCCPVVIMEDEGQGTDDKDTPNDFVHRLFCRTKASQHFCTLLLIFGVSILTGLFFVYITFLFILVPINHVIDEAPARILSIKQTVVILFGAAITYKIYEDRKFETYLDYLVRAATNKDKIKDRHFKNIKEKDWEKMSRNERRKEVAYVALKAIYETAKVNPVPPAPPETLDVEA